MSYAAWRVAFSGAQRVPLIFENPHPYSALARLEENKTERTHECTYQSECGDPRCGGVVRARRGAWVRGYGQGDCVQTPPFRQLFGFQLPRLLRRVEPCCAILSRL